MAVGIRRSHESRVQSPEPKKKICGFLFLVFLSVPSVLSVANGFSFLFPFVHFVDESLLLYPLRFSGLFFFAPSGLRSFALKKEILHLLVLLQNNIPRAPRVPRGLRFGFCGPNFCSNLCKSVVALIDLRFPASVVLRVLGVSVVRRCWWFLVLGAQPCALIKSV